MVPMSSVEVSLDLAKTYLNLLFGAWTFILYDGRGIHLGLVGLEQAPTNA
jgi:hypothetical protein